MTLRPAFKPVPLLIAAALTAAEGALVVAYAVLELANTSSDRLALGLTTTVFFAAYGAGLLVCARALTRRRSWARSPIVLAQLIQLGLAWNLRGGDTTAVAVAVAAVGLAVLVGLFHPASIAALADVPEEPGGPDEPGSR